jgi:hypothetical protein
MIYTVIWTPNADQNLADIRVQHFSHGLAAISAAANAIDAALRVNPLTRGTLLYDVIRTLSIPPLNVDFEIDDGDMKVYVLTVWHD